jgi:hypothetical protein
MSAASSPSAPARRVAAPARAAGAPVARAAQAAAVAAAVVSFDQHDDEFRLNLSDIPRMRESMEVDGLKPSLLSRLFDLVAPLKS